MSRKVQGLLSADSGIRRLLQFSIKMSFLRVEERIEPWKKEKI
jgi:hypothetical protein